MAKFPENWSVKAGDSFAGGTLTAQGAAEVNGHRVRVMNGEKTVTEKVVETYYRKANVTAEELTKASKALGTTPW